MSIFLDKNNIVSRSYDDLRLRLFSYLDPNWYPVNVINSSTYDVMSTYADQMSSASIETRDTFRDLGIDGVRTVEGLDRDYSRMYDVFGSVFEASKHYLQDYEFYDNTYALEGYRQQLRFLSIAALNGGTIGALNDVGYAFTGMPLHIIEPKTDQIGWILTTRVGIVLEIGDNYLILDREIFGVGRIIYLEDVSPYEVGDTASLSYSKLGVNTKLLGEKKHYSGVVLTMYVAAAMHGDISFTSAVDNALRNVTKSDIKHEITYSADFVYDIPGD